MTHEHTPEETSYLWENIPRELMVRAKAKCRKQIPPIAIKWKLLELLRDWVNKPDKRP